MPTFLFLLLLYNVASTLHDPLPPQETVPTFRDPLPPQEVVLTQCDPLPLQEVVPTLRDLLPPQEVVPTLRDPLPPQEMFPTRHDPFPPQEVVPTLLDPLPPQEMFLTRHDPFPPQEVVPTLRDHLPPQELVPTLRDPLQPQEVVPTLRDLCLLPVPNWYLLGLQLGVSADELDVIERNYPRDNHMCKAKMFGTWLRMDTSSTYEKLARALVAVGKRNIAEAMCAARGTKAKQNLHVHVCYSVYVHNVELGGGMN